MAPDELVVVQFLEDKRVVDFVIFLVCYVAIPPTAKQLPPRGRQSSCSTKWFLTTGYQPHTLRRASVNLIPKYVELGTPQRVQPESSIIESINKV